VLKLLLPSKHATEKPHSSPALLSPTTLVTSP
jgi:hypothetical protein